MNYDQLTNELAALYKDLRTGKVDPGLAHELNNTAQNIHSVVRLGLLNAKLNGVRPNLAFFVQARKAAVKATAKKASKPNGR